jgi:hypothetical protein
MGLKKTRVKFIKTFICDGTLSIKNFLLMLKELKNPNFEAFGGQWSIGPY